MRESSVDESKDGAYSIQKSRGYENPRSNSIGRVLMQRGPNQPIFTSGDSNEPFLKRNGYNFANKKVH